jgi:hypothetical protein
VTTAKFLEGIGGGLADRWLATLFTPAFVFWLGGGAAALQKWGWQDVETQFIQLDEPLQIAVLVLALLGVAASGYVVQQFDFTILRLLEGYWPDWCRPLQKRLLKGQKRQFHQLDQQLQDLSRKGLATLSPDDRNAYIQADLDLSNFPVRSDRLMPTRLGNILRAAEDRSGEKYGLDAVICWPRFWLVLPDGVKTELSEARNALNLTARLWLWSLLFCLWSPGFQVWWPLALGIIAALFAHRWMLRAASVYGDLLEASFDLHRFKLYAALHWPLPQNPAEELPLGNALTAYLWHGSDQPHPQFTWPES